MTVAASTAGNRRSRAARSRWRVHAGLVGCTAASLAVEPILSLHILLGLAFIALVGAHLVQRRRVSAALIGRVGSPGSWLTPSGQLALADLLLAALTLAMFGSGLWDWLSGHPTTIRWHAITGVVLAGFLLVHTIRRRRRMHDSRVR